MLKVQRCYAKRGLKFLRARSRDCQAMGVPEQSHTARPVNR